jgi:mRNA interferase RelE/StbE
LTYSVAWEEHALDAAVGFLADDPYGLRQVMAAIDVLAADPRPVGSAEYGSPDLRRVHVGRYRVLYEITDAKATIVIMHVGRTG